MPKMLKPKESRISISVREVILVAALVVAGVSWYKEYERSHEVVKELEMVKRRFSSMLEAENTLRDHPAQGPIRMLLTEMGTPRLQWSMELKVADDSNAEPPKSNEPAASSETK